ncbi:MAG TPA: 4'-phosphopantetheinyl transferase superfamily protein [bacterium]|nr:4'-phosphopantetheinyl transferase superfamily protein [bacterium]
MKDSEVQFNLSHTDGLIACSVARRRMGIDVEKMAEGEKKGRNWRLLVERFFSMDEKKYLSSHDLENQNRIFYRIFTMKEAVLKATGSGLNRFSENVSVPLTMAEKISGDGWDYFVKFFEPGGFCLSHAAENRDCPPKYRLFEWAESFFENRFKFDSPNLMEGTYGHLHG